MNLSQATELLKKLIAIPSLSGQEKPALDFLTNYFHNRGWQTEIFPNPDSDNNYLILVTFGRPKVLFTTHVDVVPAKPEQFTPVIKDQRIYGRGANDAKGILVSMIAACSILEDAGEKDFGLLVVFEEETHSTGAKLAAKKLVNYGVQYLINGEPTEGKLGLGHKGIVAFELKCTGKNAHSGYPELGIDANKQLIKLAHQLYATNFGEDSVMGKATINLGVIQGGVASNVISDHAELQGLVRIVSSAQGVCEQLQDLVGNQAELKFKTFQDPIKLETLPGFETIDVSYYTDLPALLAMGAKGFLYGPGKIERAHTDQECVELAELELAIQDYQKIFRHLKEA